MRIRLDYDRDGLEVTLPDRNVAVLRMNPSEPLRDARRTTAEALAAPIGSKPLGDLARGKRTACVVVSDVTRPVPNRDILPPLLAALERSGIKREAITLLVATGLHRPNEGGELAEMVGEDLARSYRFVNHFAKIPKSHKYLGDTARGTPAFVDKVYLEADLKITTGLLEPHLMAGYSGGRKSICPGIAGLETVRVWHGPKYLESPNAVNGNLVDNLVHEESLAIAKMAGVDFIVNAVLNEKRRTIGIFAGHLEAAFEAGVRLTDRVVKAKLDAPADIVVTSSAGYPLDTTWYQSVKGLVGAMPAVKKGGTIIMAVGLRDGVGSPEFTRLALETRSLDEFMDQIVNQGRFVIDQWQLEEMAKVKQHADVMVFTHGLPKETLRKLFLEPVDSVEDGLERALAKHGRDARIAVIPKGPYVIPVIGNG
ncbi:MAG: nickel-dependent lactate racemase [Planctomycetes bacterium]|nr:nickel-dependent lactate racemase [Planctomycetota bacterium]